MKKASPSGKLGGLASVPTHCTFKAVRIEEENRNSLCFISGEETAFPKVKKGINSLAVSCLLSHAAMRNTMPTPTVRLQALPLFPQICPKMVLSSFKKNGKIAVSL